MDWYEVLSTGLGWLLIGAVNYSALFGLIACFQWLFPTMNWFVHVGMMWVMLSSCWLVMERDDLDAITVTLALSAPLAILVVSPMVVVGEMWNVPYIEI